MAQARHYAQTHSKDEVMPTGAIIVGPDGGLVKGFGANGSDYHKSHGCERVRQHVPTGEGYELCEGCSPENHAEVRAIKSVKESAQGADLYLWGHWWCCKTCWNKMIEAGIKNVYLLEGSEILFNKEHPDNIVGRQFETM